jgi:hypothetical protein
MTFSMDRLQIDQIELDNINRLLDKSEAELEDLEAEESLHQAAVLAHQLPSRIREHLNAFRLGQLSGVLCISGYVTDQARLGPTPAHWRDRPDPSPAHREEMLLVMLGSLIGDPFAWATQQVLQSRFSDVWSRCHVS